MSGLVRWGILSTARIARTIIQGIGYSADSCIQAVASRDITRAREWAREHGVPRVFGSYEDLLHSGEVDVIYNPLPNSMHAEWTIKALEAGLPVLCEKPFAANAAEARAVVAASKRTGRLVAEAFMYRYHPVYDRVMEIIQQGAIGKVILIRSAFGFHLCDRSDIRASSELAGGALLDVGCYCVNLSRRIADCEPIRASAFARCTSVDDTLIGMLEFPNGALAQFECSIEGFRQAQAEIMGTEGQIVLESPWVPGENQAQFTLCHGDRREVVMTAGANCFRLEIEDFVQAFRTHRPLRWPPEDPIHNMAAIDALRESAQEGVAVPVEQG